MPIWLRIVAGVLAGLVAGSLVNMGLVALGPSIVPPPPGADMTTAEGLKAAMPLMGPQHFLMPFLAHALGTLAGAWVAGLVARPRPTVAVAAIGLLFMAGGIAASFMIPAPAWFIATDLLLAYLPMAGLALYLLRRHDAAA
ncbi:MAG: hypothetical protein ACKVQR_02270 [Aquabacterium sp.]